MKTDLIITGYGCKVSKTRERIIVSSKSGHWEERPIRNIDKILIQGPATLTSPAIHLALEHGVDIVFQNPKKFFLPAGRVMPTDSKGTSGL